MVESTMLKRLASSWHFHPGVKLCLLHVQLGFSVYLTDFGQMKGKVVRLSEWPISSSVTLCSGSLDEQRGRCELSAYVSGVTF